MFKGGEAAASLPLADRSQGKRVISLSLQSSGEKEREEERVQTKKKREKQVTLLLRDPATGKGEKKVTCF